jgi:hypothetical protein
MWGEEPSSPSMIEEEDDEYNFDQEYPVGNLFTFCIQNYSFSKFIRDH